MTGLSISQGASSSKLNLDATLHRTSAPSNLANRIDSQHHDSVSARQQQRLRSAMAVLSLLAIFFCATSPLLLATADALPVVSLTTACSQPATKQQLQIRHQQQALDFVAMAARVSGRSSKSIEKAFLEQLKQEYEAGEQEQLEMPEPQISLGDGGGLRVELDNNELDPMAKTTVKNLLGPKGRDQNTAAKGHIAKYNEPEDDVVTGRTHEFRQSLRHLGVRDENVFETGWSDIEPVKDYPTFQKKLKNLILGYEKKHPGASHKCISGEYDRDGLGRNPTHRACWDAARELIDEHPTGYPSSNQLWDFRFYRTYTYYKSPEHREAQYIRAFPQFLKYKQRALDQYKKWKPSQGELAWGYHSVKALIDASYNDPYVYMDMLDNDPTNPQNPLHVLSPDTILVQSPEDKTQLLDRLPPKDLEAIRALEDLENEEAENILERFEQAMRGPEGQGYKLPQCMKFNAVTMPLES
ncbi:hypothetical protein BG005_004972 [Podila minutissima]|nr:hypothetical protein BG005_004972 [Podila minutissima]